MPKRKPKPVAGSLTLTGSAVLTIQAAGDKPAQRRFEIVAYTGEALHQWWWEAPVVVDLDGIDAGSGVLPILDNHYASREAVVGQSETAEVRDGKFVLAGFMILGQNTAQRKDPGRDICEKADAGFKWQASIGAQCEQKDFIAEGNTVECNGRTYEGPVYVSRKTKIREVSFVVIGADSETSVVVATGDRTMQTFADWIKALGLDEATFTAEQRTRWQALYAKDCKSGDDEDDDEDDEDEDEEEDDDEPADDDKKPPKKKAKAKKDAEAGGKPRPGKNGDILAAYREEAAAELKRHRRLQTVCAAYPGATVAVAGQQVPALEHAIAAGWSVNKLKASLLEWVRSSRPTVPVTWYSPSQPEVSEAVIEAAVLNAGNCKLWDDDFYFSGKGDQKKRRVDFKTQRETQQALKARYTDQVLQAAHTTYRHGIDLSQVLYACSRLNGFSMRDERISDGNIENVLRAAFTPRADLRDRIQAEGASTISIQNVLANVLNKYILEGYLYVDQSMFKITATRPVKDFKPTKSINVFGDFVYKKLNADGTIANAAMTDEAFANYVDTFARMMSLSRKTIIDDDLSALTTVPRLHGIGAMDALNNLFWTVWLNGMGNGPDGAAFWATRSAAVNALGGGALNDNYMSGSGTALSSASLQQGVYTFRKQVKPNGQPLGVETKILLVPPELWVTGRELVEASSLVYGGSTAAKQPNKNIWEGQFELVESPFLSNSTYTGYSTTAWWILADPEMTATVDTAFLNGQRTPTVQTAQADFNSLGIMIRGFFDFGVAPMNTRAGLKSKGAA